MMKSVVSVIVPVYNCSADLRRSIASLLKQTMKEWIAICVDDGSTDGSGELLEEFAKKDSRIHVIHKNNGGAASARNRALDMVQTEYIVMLDADDEWEECALERMCLAIDESSCDLVTTGMQFHKADGEIFYRSFPLSGCVDNSPWFFARYTNKGPVPYLFRKSIIDKYEIRFSEDVSVGEDYLFIYSYSICAKKIFYIQDCLYKYMYFHRAESLSTSFYYGHGSFADYKAYVEQPLRVRQFLYSKNFDKEKIFRYNYELSRDFFLRYHLSSMCVRSLTKRKALKRALRPAVMEICSNLSFVELLTLLPERYSCIACIWRRMQVMMPNFTNYIKKLLRARRS